MKKNSFEIIRLSKITINVNNGEFWVVPSILKIFTPKRGDFVIKKAKNLKEIYEYNNLQVGNYYFSFNRDFDFGLFNQLQKMSILKNLEINKKVLNIIEKNKVWFFNYNDLIKIKFDEKNIYKIYRGNSFMINESNYFENYIELLKNKGFKNQEWIFYWTGSKFELDNIIK